MPSWTPQTLIEQYKAYVADVGNIGTRYTTAQTFYLSVVSALVAVVTFVGKDLGPPQKYSWLVIAFVLLFVALICYVWWRTLGFFSNLFRVKFGVLRNMEKSDLYAIFTEEENELKKHRRLIDDEKFIPVIIGFAALAGAVLSIIACACGFSLAR